MKAVDKVLYEELKKNSGRLFFVLFLILMTVGIEAIVPWPFKILIDNVLSPNPITSGGWFESVLAVFSSRELLGFFVVLLYFLSSFSLAIVEYMHAIVTKKVIKRMTIDFSKRAFENLENLSIGFYKKQKIGDYIYRLGYDVAALGEFIEEGVLPMIMSSLMIVTTLAIMMVISVKLTLLAFIALPFLTYGLYSFNAHIAYTTKRSEFYGSAAFAFIEEALSHLKIIQAFSQEERQSAKFGEKTETSLMSDLSFYRVDFLLTLLVGLVIAISYSFIIIYGIRSVFEGTLTTGLLVVFIFYLDNITIPIVSLITAMAAIKHSYVKLRRMNEFFTSKTHTDEGGKITEVTDSSIKFDHVTYKGDKGVVILDDVSFEIRPGERTVIFGLNGSGKTSVLNLLMRFTDAPSEGTIYLGGRDLMDYDVRELRKAISYIPQEITLFDDTIKTNIAFGSQENVSIKEIRTAAKLAAAHDFIRRMPRGYAYRVGEAGNLLSGGQRQRVMIARALMKKDAKMLLFDETFSALDVKSREEVLHNIYDFSKSKTTIIVSNVFSIISAAEHVIVLNRGKVIFDGKPSRLQKETALYRIILENN